MPSHYKKRKYSKKRKFSSRKKKGFRKRRTLYTPYGGSVELKYYDNPKNGTVVAGHDVNPILSVTEGLGVGNDNNTRVGRKVQVKSIWLRGAIWNNTGEWDCPVTMYVIRDNCPNGVAAPKLSDTLAAGTITPRITPSAVVPTMHTTNIGFPNIDTQKRYQVLLEKTMTVGPNRSHAMFDKYMPVNFETCWNGTTGTATQLINNGVFVYFVKQTATGVAASVTLNAQEIHVDINCRIRYTDN